MPATYTSIHFHVVFATKERMPIIASEWKPRLHAYLGGIAKAKGATPLEIGGTNDHVHMLLGLRATDAIAPVVREIKKGSNGFVHEEFIRMSRRAPSFYGCLSDKVRLLSGLFSAVGYWPFIPKPQTPPTSARATS